MPAPRKPRRSRLDDGSTTMTLEQYKAAQASKDIAALRRTGTDMSAHVSAPESVKTSKSGE